MQAPIRSINSTPEGLYVASFWVLVVYVLLLYLARACYFGSDFFLLLFLSRITSSRIVFTFSVCRCMPTCMFFRGVCACDIIQSCRTRRHVPESLADSLPQCLMGMSVVERVVLRMSPGLES